MTHDRARSTTDTPGSASAARPEPTLQDVEASLRQHLLRARDVQHVYQELRTRVVGPLATIVRQHEVTPEGTCRACSSDGPVPCAAVAPIARDLGLHLRWLNPAAS